MPVNTFGESNLILKETSAMVPNEKQAQHDLPSWKASRRANLKHCSIIGPTTVEGMAACPCCNVQRKEGRQTVGETALPASRHESLFKDNGSDTDSMNDLDEEDHMMPGVLQDGVAYTIKQDLAQGWVHKKGTGMDWLGSRAWKPRWAVLSLARLAGHEADVPLLQIFWYSSSPTPSTVIHLDSAVVLPEDDTDQSKWNCFRFKTRHLKKSCDESSIQVTRTFSCPKEGRDAWVYAINQALLGYEKEKASARKNSSIPLSPPRQSHSLSWATDAFPSALQRNRDFAPIPPTSLRSHSIKHCVPRPEPPLIGEAFLGQAFD